MYLGETLEIRRGHALSIVFYRLTTEQHYFLVARKEFVTLMASADILGFGLERIDVEHKNVSSS